MLAFFSMVGTAFAELRKLPPVIRWGAAVLVGLLAVEVVGKEAISVYVAMQTAPAQVEKIRGEGAQGQGLAFNPDKAVADRQTPAEKLVALRLACQAPSSAEYRRLLAKEGSDFEVSHVVESCAKLFPAN